MQVSDTEKNNDTQNFCPIFIYVSFQLTITITIQVLQQHEDSIKYK